MHLLRKRLYRKKDISLIASINDILNQRIGFNQSSTSNFITENIYSTVQTLCHVIIEMEIQQEQEIFTKTNYHQNMKKILLVTLVFVAIHVHAQTQFIQSGKIEFEKKVNLYKEIEAAYPCSII